MIVPSANTASALSNGKLFCRRTSSRPVLRSVGGIERIPIQETREYVAKVLANIQVYRSRLGEEQAALRLEEDLNRARVAAGKPGGPSDG